MECKYWRIVQSGFVFFLTLNFQSVSRKPAGKLSLCIFCYFSAWEYSWPTNFFPSNKVPWFRIQMTCKTRWVLFVAQKKNNFEAHEYFSCCHMCLKYWLKTVSTKFLYAWHWILFTLKTTTKTNNKENIVKFLLQDYVYLMNRFLANNKGSIRKKMLTIWIFSIEIQCLCV